MTTLLGVAAIALLFALFGLLRPAGACNGHCGTCTGSCPLLESDDEKD